MSDKNYSITTSIIVTRDNDVFVSDKSSGYEGNEKEEFEFRTKIENSCRSIIRTKIIRWTRFTGIDRGVMQVEMSWEEGNRWKPKFEIREDIVACLKKDLIAKIVEGFY